MCLCCTRHPFGVSSHCPAPSTKCFASNVACMLWHDSVFLTLWHKWGLSKNKSWLPCYLQSKSELRPELAETVHLGSITGISSWCAPWFNNNQNVYLAQRLGGLHWKPNSSIRCLLNHCRRWLQLAWPAVPQKDEEKSSAMLRTCSRIHFKRWQNETRTKGTSSWLAECCQQKRHWNNTILTCFDEVWP